MTITSQGNAESFEVVVDDDGALMVPAAELARHGVRPGTHLRVVVPGEPSTRRAGPSAGKLAGLVPAELIEEWSQALADDRAERRAALGPIAG